MPACSSVCDTLRTDLDNGDECVHCGAVYLDARQRREVYTPAPVAVKVVSSPTSSQVAPHRRLGWFHNVQLAGHRGLDKRARGR